MRICITQKDIEEGRVGEAYYCPVALASKRAGARFGYSNASVGNQNIYFKKNRREPVKRDGMGRVFKFIRDFDSGKSVKPFWFQVDDLPRAHTRRQS